MTRLQDQLNQLGAQIAEIDAELESMDREAEKVDSASDLLVRGVEAFDGGDWEGARVLLDKFVEVSESLKRFPDTYRRWRPLVLRARIKSAICFVQSSDSDVLATTSRGIWECDDVLDEIGDAADPELRGVADAATALKSHLVSLQERWKAEVRKLRGQ